MRLGRPHPADGSDRDELEQLVDIADATRRKLPSFEAKALLLLGDTLGRVDRAAVAYAFGQAHAVAASQGSLLWQQRAPANDRSRRPMTGPPTSTT